MLVLRVFEITSNVHRRGLVRSFLVVPEPLVDFSAWETDALGNRLNALIGKLLAFVPFLQ
jgi:hypothetical protein